MSGGKPIGAQRASSEGEFLYMGFYSGGCGMTTR